MNRFKALSGLILLVALSFACSDDKDEKYDYSVRENKVVSLIENRQDPVEFQLIYGSVDQKPFYYTPGVEEFYETYDLLNVTVTYDPVDEWSETHFVEVKDADGKLITSFHTWVYIYTSVYNIDYNGDIPVYSSAYDNNIKKVTYARGFYTYSGRVAIESFPLEGAIYEQREDGLARIGSVSLSGIFPDNAQEYKLNSLVPDETYENALKSYIQRLYKDLGIN
ncbi:MAG: hypothetical protein LUE26_11900 [Alistipes sp.]|nr:hypothetical protein [Alistipes sp.]